MKAQPWETPTGTAAVETAELGPKGLTLIDDNNNAVFTSGSDQDAWKLNNDSFLELRNDGGLVLVYIEKTVTDSVTFENIKEVWRQGVGNFEPKEKDLPKSEIKSIKYPTVDSTLPAVQEPTTKQYTVLQAEIPVSFTLGTVGGTVTFQGPTLKQDKQDELDFNFSRETLRTFGPGAALEGPIPLINLLQVDQTVQGWSGAKIVNSDIHELVHLRNGRQSVNANGEKTLTGKITDDTVTAKNVRFTTQLFKVHIKDWPFAGEVTATYSDGTKQDAGFGGTLSGDIWTIDVRAERLDGTQWIPQAFL